MSDGDLIALCVALSAGFGLLVFVAARAERHSRFIARWVHFLAGHRQLPRFRAARRLLPSLLSIVELFVGGAVIVLLGGPYRDAPVPPPTPLVALIVLWLAGSAALAVSTIVVGRTGRPAWLVMKPIRGMTPDEIEDWIDVHADWDQVRRAQRRGRD